MDLIPRSEVQILTTGLATKLNPNQLANFRVDDLQLLVERGYLNLAALEAAREEDLREAGLKTALIRILQQAGVVGAAAGPGSGSSGAGASAAGLGVGSTAGAAQAVMERLDRLLEEVQEVKARQGQLSVLLRLELIRCRFTASVASSKRDNNQPFKVALIQAYGDEEDCLVVELLERQRPAVASGGAGVADAANAGGADANPGPDTMRSLRCTVTGLRLPQYNVIAAHLFPRHLSAEANAFLGITSIDDVRNGLLWCSPVEAAYSDSRVCFAPSGGVPPMSGSGASCASSSSNSGGGPSTVTYRFHVIDNTWLGMQLVDTPRMQRLSPPAKELLGDITWKDLDGKEIAFAASPSRPTRPFSGALLFHALQALDAARERGSLVPGKDELVLTAWGPSEQASPSASRVREWLDTSDP